MYLARRALGLSSATLESRPTLRQWLRVQLDEFPYSDIIPSKSISLRGVLALFRTFSHHVATFVQHSMDTSSSRLHISAYIATSPGVLDQR